MSSLAQGHEYEAAKHYERVGYDINIFNSTNFGIRNLYIYIYVCVCVCVWCVSVCEYFIYSFFFFFRFKKCIEVGMSRDGE